MDDPFANPFLQPENEEEDPFANPFVKQDAAKNDPFANPFVTDQSAETLSPPESVVSQNPPVMSSSPLVDPYAVTPQVLQNVDQQLDSAIIFYQNALEIHKDFVKAHHNIGVCYEQKGDESRALRAYGQALKYNPKIL